MGRDAEEWAEMAGTFTSRKKIYQVSGTEMEEKMTGLRSVREVKKMKIEFDVLKRWSPGQAVLIDKARHREDLFQVWWAFFMKLFFSPPPQVAPQVGFLEVWPNPLKIQGFYAHRVVTTHPHHR